MDEGAITKSEEEREAARTFNDRASTELTERETSENVLGSWEHAEILSDDELLDIMRRDGMLAIHVIPRNGDVTILGGLITPTVVRNKREGLDPSKKQFLHPSNAIHFSINTSFYTQENSEEIVDDPYGLGIKGLRKFRRIAFVTHPGCLAASHDVADFRNESSFGDCPVRGYTDDPFDVSNDVDVRNGFFLIRNENVDPATGEPVTQLTKEQYYKNNHFDKGMNEWVDSHGLTQEPPTGHHFAITSRDYWQGRIEAQQLPDNLKPRFFFYENDGSFKNEFGGNDFAFALDQFRRANHLPEPNAGVLAKDIESIGFSTVEHGKHGMGEEGLGQFLRLHSHHQTEYATETKNPEREDILSKTYKATYTVIKNDIDEGRITPEDLEKKIIAYQINLRHYALNLHDVRHRQRRGAQFEERAVHSEWVKYVYAEAELAAAVSLRYYRNDTRD